MHKVSSCQLRQHLSKCLQTTEYSHISSISVSSWAQKCYSWYSGWTRDMCADGLDKGSVQRDASHDLMSGRLTLERGTKGWTSTSHKRPKPTPWTFSFTYLLPCHVGADWQGEYLHHITIILLIQINENARTTRKLEYVRLNHNVLYYSSSPLIRVSAVQQVNCHIHI